mgnify:CR=1 FL=1
MNEIESDSLIEIILSNNNLSEFLDQIETLQQFQSTMRDDVKRLTILKEDLEDWSSNDRDSWMLVISAEGICENG